MNEGWERTRYGGVRRTRVVQNRRTPLRFSGSRRIVTLPRVQIKFRERLGLPECPYVVRWRIETSWGSVRVHHWLAPDDDRAFHDHPWDFFTIIIRGGYTDKSPNGSEYLRAGMAQYRSALHQHTVYPDPGGAWTIVFTGPKIRNWGFWVEGKFRKANKYFAKYGHHVCN